MGGWGRELPLRGKNKRNSCTRRAADFSRRRRLGRNHWVLPHRCKNKRRFLHAASRERQLPEKNNEQAFFSGFSAPPRTQVRGEPKCRAESSADLLKDYWLGT